MTNAVLNRHDKLKIVTPVLRMGGYLRLSTADPLDDPDGTTTATQRQLLAIKSFAAQHGWALSDVFEDMVSAFKGKLRSEFQRLINAILNKEIDGVVAWHIDRISRDLWPFAQLMDACHKTGAFLVTVTDGVDTREPSGEFIASILVSHARMSSEDTRRRVRAKHKALADEGRPLGGTRPFGYEPHRAAIIPEEAELVREAYTRIVDSGESLHGVVWDWHRRGVKSVLGKSWTAATLRQTLRSAGLSGQRELHGVFTRGLWTPILTPEETLRLRQTLESRPSMNTTGRSPRKHVLTGLLRCGLCGCTLSHRPTAKGVRHYVCVRKPTTNNCGHLSRSAAPIEALVKEQVLIVLDSPELLAYLARPDGSDNDALREAIRLDEESLLELSADYYDHKAISKPEFFRNRDVIAARLEASRKRLARISGTGLLESLVGAGEEVRRRWDLAGMPWQRSVIEAVLDHIVVKPSNKGRRTFDPSLIGVVWKF